MAPDVVENGTGVINRLCVSDVKEATAERGGPGAARVKSNAEPAAIGQEVDDLVRAEVDAARDAVPVVAAAPTDEEDAGVRSGAGWHGQRDPQPSVVDRDGEINQLKAGVRGHPVFWHLLGD